MFPDIRAHPQSSDYHLSLNGKINDLMHLRGQNNHILKKQRTWPKIGPAISEKVTSCLEFRYSRVGLREIKKVCSLRFRFNVMIHDLTFDLLMTFFKYS